MSFIIFGESYFIKSPYDIAIEYYTEDEQLKSQIEDYFKTSGEQFVYPLKKLYEKYNAKSNVVFRNQIKGKFAARNAFCYCKQCAELIKSTEDRFEIVSWDYEETCRKCWNLNEDKRLAQIDETMYTALENSAFHGLTNVELSLFREIIRYGDYAQAGKRLGMDEWSLKQTLEKLKEMHLLHFDILGFGIRILPEYNVLVEQKDTAVKQFVTDNNKALYKSLRRQHPYVYPEASIAAFVDINKLQHCLTEKWHLNYILAARVDCVICDEDGYPLFAAEYQGSGHNEPKMKVKDEFKKMILINAGIPINYYRFEKNQLKQIK